MLGERVLFRLDHHMLKCWLTMEVILWHRHFPTAVRAQRLPVTDDQRGFFQEPSEQRKKGINAKLSK